MTCTRMCTRASTRTVSTPTSRACARALRLCLDAGSAGCYTFGGFPQLCRASREDSNIFCMLHISRVGLSYQPDTSRREDIDVEETVSVIKANRPLIQGVKIRAVGPGVPRMGVEMVRLAKQAATEGGVRLMVHIGDRSIVGGDGSRADHHAPPSATAGQG